MSKGNHFMHVAISQASRAAMCNTGYESAGVAHQKPMAQIRRECNEFIKRADAQRKRYQNRRILNAQV